MSKGKSTTTTSNTIDPGLMNIYKDVYGIGKTIANQPYLPYTGPQVAGFNPDQLAGFDTTRSNYLKSLTADPRTKLNELMTGSAPSFLTGDISGYMNPYTQNVVDQQLRELGRQGTQERQRIGAGAVGA